MIPALTNCSKSFLKIIRVFLSISNVTGFQTVLYGFYMKDFVTIDEIHCISVILFQ